MTTSTADHSLTRHIGLGHGVALYVSAILGAGVLVLPGQAATIAGPASLASWAFACAMGLPLAVMFASLARRFPDAGGVSTYVRHGLGPLSGGVCGWMFFVAGSVGQTIVPLTGGYYVAQAAGLSSGWALPVALAILVVATVSNMLGMKVSGRVQMALATGVAVALAVTIAVAVPDMALERLEPFAPHGLPAVGAASIVLFFAFAGWETIAHLAEEFTDPRRDLPRAVACTLVIITVLYLGIAAAVVLTGTYGSSRIDHVALGLILQQALGPGATAIAAGVAVLISLATTTAFISGVSRLAYSLARDGWLPAPVGALDDRGVPRAGVFAVFAVALAGLVVSAVLGWGTEELITVPSTLVVAVYALTAIAGVRLLHGSGRVAAAAAILLTIVVVPSALQHLLVPASVTVVALTSRWTLRRRSKR